MQHLNCYIKHAGEVRRRESDAGIATVARSGVITTLYVKVVNNMLGYGRYLARNGLSALLIPPGIWTFVEIKG